MASVRETAHQQLDAWLDNLSPIFDQPKPPTLRELSNQFTQTRGQLLGGCLQSISEALYAHFKEQRQSICPTCGARLNRKRLDTKQLLTLQGPVVLNRPYFYCRQCKTGHHPLDEALELARGVHQFDIQEKLLKHNIELPYELSAQLVGELIGTPLSNHLGHDLLQRTLTSADLETVIPDTTEIQRRIEQAKTTDDERPILVVALDGAMAPTRPKAKRDKKRGPGEWKEAKGVRLYLATRDDRIIQIASWHQIQDAEAMRSDLHKIAARIPKEAVRIVLLGDGAAWVWNTLVECFPEGKQILDYYHCREHLYTVANAHYGDTPQAIQWIEATLARLNEKRISHVIAGLHRMETTHAATDQEIEKLITYLRNQQHRLDYETCKQAGLPIGSGGIESANKFISHVRLKRSGAWWIKENGNGMLRLRCALYNGTFDKVFEKYRQAALGFSGTKW